MHDRAEATHECTVDMLVPVLQGMLDSIDDLLGLGLPGTCPSPLAPSAP